MAPAKGGSYSPRCSKTDPRVQALTSVEVESARGWRIAKEKASRKIDAVVALAMACVAAPEPRVRVIGADQRGETPDLTALLRAGVRRVLELD